LLLLLPVVVVTLAAGSGCGCREPLTLVELEEEDGEAGGVEVIKVVGAILKAS